MRTNRQFEPFAPRGRRTVVAILLTFAVLSAGGVVLSLRATARDRNRAATLQVAARQRTLTERYVNDVLLTRGGSRADAPYTARVLRKSVDALLVGGVAPAVNGDDDEARVGAASGTIIREQLRQERRLLTDLTATGDAILHGRPMPRATRAREALSVSEPTQKLRVLAALSENVSLNAARTIARATDRNIGHLMALQITLGAVGLVIALLLGWALVTATRRQTAHFRSIVVSSSDLVFVLAASGCRYVSQSVSALLGRDARELLGDRYLELVDPDDRSTVRSAGEHGQPHEILFRVLDRFGEQRTLQAHVTDLRDDRSIRGIVLNARDITERVALEQELTHQAFHDGLTGLANRALFRDRLEHSLVRSERSGEPTSVLVIDLDGFKQVNDTLGHDAGDQLLQHVAEQLAGAMRPSDTLARLGGDEFAMLLESTTEAEAQAIAERALGSIRRPVTIDDRELSIGASIGVSVHTRGAEGREELVRRADVAMYAAKEAGRGRCEPFRPEMEQDAGEALAMNGKLAHALARHEFALHYQPTFDIETGVIVGAEALIRWNSATRGVVSPARFIPLSETTGLIHAIGEFVVSEAVTQTKRWEDEGLLPDGFVTWVNLSGPELSSDGIAQRVAQVLEATGLPAARLGIEVTETAIVVEGAPAERARAALQALHDLGVHIALDDFGTGFSSLGHLRRFPIDVIKVDRSFIQGVEHNSKDAAIAANLASLAHTLGLVAVAEGIESTGQLDVLRNLGCDRGQGFLLARPAPAEELSRLLGQRRRAVPFDGDAAAPVAVPHAGTELPRG